MCLLQLYIRISRARELIRVYVCRAIYNLRSGPPSPHMLFSLSLSLARPTRKRILCVTLISYEFTFQLMLRLIVLLIKRYFFSN